MIRYRYLFFSAVILVGLLFFMFMMQRRTDEMGVELKEIVTTSATDASPVTFVYPCELGKTAFELLNSRAIVMGEDTEAGKMVTSINGKEAGGGRFWIYSVDDRESTAAAELYKCMGEETIKWVLK